MNEGAGAKLSLMKVLIVKCDNNMSTYKRLRSGIGAGDYQEVDRLLSDLEESNIATLNDLQDEMANGVNIVQCVGQLAEQIIKEKRAQDQKRGRSVSPAATAADAKNPAAPSLQQLQDMEMRNAELGRQLHNLQSENEKLRTTMREMVDDYSKQLDVRDQAIQQLQSQSDVVQQNEVSMLVYKENEALKQENRMLRDKVTMIDEELARVTAGRGPEGDFRALQEENERLNIALMEKTRQADKQLEEQKNEWAGIYGGHQTQVDQMQREISMLNQENEKLLRQLEVLERAPPGKGGANPAPSQLQKDLTETAKRLKKRELECQALWETLKDMKDSGFDINRMMQLFGRRALESKAQRKLEINK